MQLVQHIENIKCMRQLLTVSVKKATIVLPSFLLKVQANTYCPLVHPGFIPPGLKEKKKKKNKMTNAQSANREAKMSTSPT